VWPLALVLSLILVIVLLIVLLELVVLFLFRDKVVEQVHANAAAALGVGEGRILAHAHLAAGSLETGHVNWQAIIRDARVKFGKLPLSRKLLVHLDEHVSR
jgi:hypothetical protein